MIEVIDARYRVERLLGRGTLGEVVRVVDLTSDDDQPPLLALRRFTQPVERLSYGAAPALETFVRHLHRLHLLNHPFLLPLTGYGLERAGGALRPYVTMPLLNSGAPLLQTAPTLPVEGRVRLIAEVLSVLAYLHRCGMIHRNLKPENVWVLGGVVRLADVGIGLTPYNVERMTSSALGHLAPEVLAGQLPTVQSDLYSVGLLLYEALTGRFPYQRGSTRELLTNIRLYTPDVSASVPGPLAAVVQRLIDKEPEQRFQNALEALDALGHALARPLRTISPAGMKPHLPTGALVGREAELSRVETALTNTRRGLGGVVIFVGDRGMGKTALLDEVQQRAVAAGLHVMRPELAMEGDRPMHLWRALARALALLPEATDGDRAVLQAVSGDQTAGRPLEREAVAATLAALLPVFTAVRPLLLLLDDLHRASADALWLLEQVMRLSTELPLVIVGAAHISEVQPFTFPATVALRRLSLRYISALTQAVLGPAGELPIVNALLYRETDGNPFLLVEVMRVLVEQAGDISQVGIKTLPDQLFANGLQDALNRRRGMLSEQEQRLLAGLALDGDRVEPVVLSALGGGALDALLNAHEASVIAARGGRWYFSHEVLRQAFADLLDDTQRQAAHVTIASALEDARAVPSRIAHHFSKGGQEAAASPYWRQTAQQAAESGAPAAASAMLERVLPDIPAAERGAALLLLGEAYAQISQPERARRSLEQALLTLSDAAEKGRALLALAIITRGEAAPDQAQSYLTQAAALPHEATRATALIGLGNLMSELGRVEEVLRYSEQALASSGLTRGQRIRTLQAVGMTYVDLNDLPQAVARLSDAYTLARDHDPREQARVLSALAGLYLVRGTYAPARAAFAQRLALALDRGDLVNAARALGNMGLASARLGQPGMAEDLLRLGLRLAQTLQIPALEAGLAYNTALYYSELLLLAEALEQFERARALATAAGSMAFAALSRMQHAYLSQLIGLISDEEARAQIDQAATLDDSADVRAARAYWRWKVTPKAERERDEAAAYYRQMVLLTQDSELAARYTELTGETLPAPALPLLPAAIARHTPDEVALLARVRALLDGSSRL